MADTRSPEDRLHGVLRIVVGGVEKTVSTLPMRAAREWWETISVARDRNLPEREKPTQTEFVTDFNRLGLEITLELIVSYDRDAALGGREWLQDHADPSELNVALNQMLANVFPFAEDTSLILAVLVAENAVKSRRPSSTNGPLPTGVSPQDHLKPRSTRRSSK